MRRKDVKKRIPWNKGLTKETDLRMQIISNKLFGDNNGMRKYGSPMKGKSQPLELRKRWSEYHKQNPSRGMLGKKLSAETIEKLRLAKLGKKHTKEHNKKISIGNKGKFVKSPSEETRKKISGTLTGKMVGEKNPFYGKTHTEDVKNKIRISNKERIVSQPTRQLLRQARLKQVLPTKSTKIEVKLQEELQKRNISFVTQKPILDRTLVDIFIEPNICIYADGCYYHCCPQCFNWNLKLTSLDTILKGAPEKDKYITEQLAQNNYKVFRFWEHEINKDVKTCVDKILRRK
jgi:DNA mismatch endonuclease (patch repair protein)